VKVTDIKGHEETRRLGRVSPVGATRRQAGCFLEPVRLLAYTEGYILARRWVSSPDAKMDWAIKGGLITPLFRWIA